jgi:formylglycine-generating enzyme required for sulfatase activity
MPRFLLLLALVPLPACYPETRKDGGSGRPSADVDTDTDSDTDTDTDADSDTDTDTGIDSNAAPSAPTVSITPSEPTDADELTCAVVTESVDPDGDAVTYSYAWSSDAGGSASGPTVSASFTTVGETWTCSVTASDGALSSAAGTASVGIDSSIADYTTSHGGTMVAITAGTFEMGSADDGPIHTVTLTHDFWIGQTEVTQAQYLAGTGMRPSSYSGCGSTCPVESVSWADAGVYANALSAAEGLEECYTATGGDLAASLGGDPYACEGYRLPTEAEWEYAARGGESYGYSGSDTVGEVAWTSENSGSTTHPVAGKVANAFGLYDMSGNVWEWTNDWHADYASGAAVDPAGATSGSDRVYRGGSWLNDPTNARVASRSYSAPASRYTNLGFRLSRSVP